jgi:sterol desaturase/sphingolipid hydroxylase (fatty acid hydroxylase superfamily)
MRHHHDIASNATTKNQPNEITSMSSFPPLPWVTAIVWPFMLILPFLMAFPSSPLFYGTTFPESWYSYDPTDPSSQPKPLGLILGLVAVAVGQLLCLLVFYFFKFGFLSSGMEPLSIQTKGARPYQFLEGLATHLAQPEGFGLLGGYLAITWMLKLMPSSYYSFEGGIEWPKLFLCLTVQDGIQYLMHLLEHGVSPSFYKYSHKPHHRFTNPRLFDAFNGSVLDTICMILIPLYCTANLVHCNVWTYMAFGSMYSNWLTLIHSEYTFPWDRLFHCVGFGTPADHHVHHAFFKYNYGHLFMWFDMVGGTYKDPTEFAPKAFNDGV